MSKLHKAPIKSVAATGVFFLGLISTPLAFAGTIVQCGAAFCSSDFSITFNGNNAGGGAFNYNAETGEIALDTTNFSGNGNNTVAFANGAIEWNMGNGNIARVSSLSGNADPILGFGLGATTGAGGSTFGFTFNLPVAISGQIFADSSVSYSLTSLSADGAQIGTIGAGNIVSAFEQDTSVGGLGSLNKGVDVGDTFFFTGGPQTNNSSVFTANNTFTGNLDYDLMVVKVDFSLSANSTVGISGFVQQTVVPVPAAVWLFGTGLLALVGVARRKV